MKNCTLLHRIIDEHYRFTSHSTTLLFCNKCIDFFLTAFSTQLFILYIIVMQHKQTSIHAKVSSRSGTLIIYFNRSCILNCDTILMSQWRLNVEMYDLFVFIELWAILYVPKALLSLGHVLQKPTYSRLSLYFAWAFLYHALIIIIIIIYDGWRLTMKKTDATFSKLWYHDKDISTWSDFLDRDTLW